MAKKIFRTTCEVTLEVEADDVEQAEALADTCLGRLIGFGLGHPSQRTVTVVEAEQGPVELWGTACTNCGDLVQVGTVDESGRCEDCGAGEVHSA